MGGEVLGFCSSGEYSVKRKEAKNRLAKIRNIIDTVAFLVSTTSEGLSHFGV